MELFISNDNLVKTIAFLILIFLSFKMIPYLYRKTKEHFLLKELSKAGIKDIDKMDGFQFEVYLKSLLKELGYKSQVTTGSYDFGADLVMKKDKKKVVIQAKRYSYKNKVSIDAIQQVYASKPYYKADECWVVTNSTFTKSAMQLAKACNVKLYDRYKLANLINKVNPSVKPKHITKTIQPSRRKCPVCSGELLQRTSKTGNYFMGCSNYPNCKHTENIAN